MGEHVSNDTQTVKIVGERRRKYAERFHEKNFAVEIRRRAAVLEYLTEQFPAPDGEASRQKLLQNGFDNRGGHNDHRAVCLPCQAPEEGLQFWRRGKLPAKFPQCLAI